MSDMIVWSMTTLLSSLFLLNSSFTVAATVHVLSLTWLQLDNQGVVFLWLWLNEECPVD